MKPTGTKRIALFGPTAVGKTGLTEALFSHGFEIINSDSIQIYEGLDIGSAKPSASLREKIPHHLLDIKKPWEEYSSGEFLSDSEKAATEIESRGNIPVYIGGTAYYFRQLIFGAPTTPKADMEVRKKIRDEIEELGNYEMWKRLGRVDPESVSRISVNDTYRITRALEVYECTGKPLSSFSVVREKDERIIPVFLMRSREEINSNIEKRADRMFEEGLSEEVGNLIKNGADSDWPSMQAIGYREFFKASDSGEMSISSVKEEIVKDTKKYAKSQITFFKSFKFPPMNPSDIGGIMEYLVSSGIDRNLFDTDEFVALDF